MEFIISRTSDRMSSPPAPIEGVRRKTVTSLDYLSLKAVQSVRDGFLKHGSAHRIEGERMVREMSVEVWVADVNSLDEVIALVESQGHEVIIGKWERNPAYWALEIYDGWRE